jgi:hypothetical protein
LVHQTNFQTLESILIRGLIPTGRPYYVTRPRPSDYERFIWFDFIGTKADKDNVYSRVGKTTATKSGVMVVLNFESVISKISELKQIPFDFYLVTDFIRYETPTEPFVLMTAENILESKMLITRLDRVKECVLCTTNKDPYITFDIKPHIERFIVCRQFYDDLAKLLDKMGLEIPIQLYDKTLKEGELMDCLP